MRPSDIRIRWTGLSSELKSVLKTTDGDVVITGQASWPDVLVKVQAKTDDLGVTVPPMVTLRTHFDVSAQLDEESLRLGGRVVVPQARVTVRELPEQVVSKSADRIRLDQPGSWKKQTGKALQTHSDLRIIIGEDVRVDAMGLKTRVRGPLHVQQMRSGGLGITGQIDLVEGTFKAYGQDLIVRKGKLLFAGLPSNPSIDMEVIRNPERTADDVRVGIRVSGTASRPTVSLFSEPAMGQEELLSYLLRGEALDPSGETDNSAITAALLGLGLSQGTGVVQGIGEVIGLEDLSVDTEGAGDGSQVVVSAYVLPGLRVKYGIGLFDSLATITLRYRLMPKVYLRAISGVDQAIDVLYRVDFDHPREFWQLLWK